MGARIVVAVDGSPESHAALRWACAEARLRTATVVATHVLSTPWELPDTDITQPASDVERAAREVLDDALRAVADCGASLEPHLLVGDPAERLLEAAADADLLVVGSRDHGFLGHARLGAVTSRLARGAPCPVVIVKQSDRSTSSEREKSPHAGA